MGTIQVPGRISGKTYSVKIKGDTPTPTEQARIRAYLDEQEGAFAQQYEAEIGKPLAAPDDGTALGRGWELGKAGAYSRIGTATEYLGSGLGLESLMQAGQRMRQEGDYEAFLESLRQPEPTRLEDVSGVGSALTYLGESIGQSGPEMLAPLAAGAIGGVAAGPAGAIGASAATAFPSFFGGNVQRQEAEVAAGRLEEVDVTSAIVSAVGQAALNSIGDKLLLGGFLKPGQKWLTRTAVGVGEGAVAEIPTEIAQQIIERKQAGLQLDDEEAINEYINAGIIGGVMGGGVRGTTAALGVGMEHPAAPGATPAAPTLALPAPEKVAGALPVPGTLEPLSAAKTPDVVVTPAPLGAVRGGPGVNVPPLSPEAKSTAASISSDAQMLSAVEAIEAEGKATVGVIQKALGLSYPAANGIMRKLESVGAVSKYAKGKERTLTLPFKASDIREAQAPVTPDVSEAAAKAAVPNVPVAEAPEPKYRKAAEKKAQAAEVEAVPTELPEVQEQATSVEAADVQATAETEPTQAGDGVPGGAPGLGDVEQRDDGTGRTEGVATPDAGGLGADLSVPVAPDAATAVQPAALTGPRLVGPRLTGSPTELQLRDAVRQLAPMREVREIAENTAAQSELDAAWAARMADKPELASLSSEYAVPDLEVLDDPTTSEDKRKILSLFQPGAVKKGKSGAAPAANAMTYFSRFKRPIDALEYIVADATLKNQRFANQKALEAEIGTLPAGDETISPAEREFFSGMTQERAKEALAWVEANMSPQAQAKVRDLQRKYRKAQEAKAPVRATSNLASSTTIGGRAATADEKAAFEQELVAQSAEKKARTAEDKALADAARSRMRGIDALLAAAQETKAPIQRRAVGMRKMSAEDQIDFVADQILGLKFSRPEDVQDLESPLHPAAVNALRRGNLELALRTVQLYAPNDRVARIVRALAPYARGTSVQLVDNLQDDDGQSLRGQYRRGYPGKPSEILLDRDEGLTIETLLHEMVHAATIKEMRNPTSPMRKRIENLFQTVKPMLSTSNGTTDVMEFLADAMSVPSFQNELAGVYPNGNPYSALRRLANEVINFVRRLLGMGQRDTRNALDITDQMVMQILDFPVSPTEISSPEEGATILNRVAQVDGSFPSRTKEFAQQFGDDASGVLAGASWGAKRTILGFMGMQPLADIATYFKITGAYELQSALQQMDAAAIKADQEVDGVLQIAQKWVKNNLNLKPLFDRVVTRSTIHQVDPSLSRDKAIQKYGAGSDRMQMYDLIQKDWAAIGKSGHDLYANMRELYRKQYQRLRDALEGKIDFVLSNNPKLAAEVKKSIYTKFFDMNRIEPYFPLARKGDFWLEYAAFDPDTNTTEPVKEAFESPRARDRAAKELETMQGVVKGPDGKPIYNYYSTMDIVRRGRTPDSLFVRDTLSIIKANLDSTGVDSATAQSIQEEITRLFVEALPETSFAKSLQRRKNTRGYMEDSLEALRVKGYSLGRQGVRYAFSNKIRAVSDAIQEQARNSNDQNKVAVIEELVARANFATNPPAGMFERMVQTMNRGAFTFTIGLNVSSALVNLSSIPAVLYPYLSGRYGSRSSAAAIGAAYKLFLNSGLQREIALPTQFEGQKTTKVRSMPSIDNYFVLDNANQYVLRDDVPAELRPMLQELSTLVDVASKNGQLNRSIYYDSIGAEDVGRARGFGDRFAAISGAMFHQVERANRQVALVAAYNLELKRLRNKPTPAERGLTEAQRRTRAAERAVYQVTETGGGATLAAAPRWAQQGIGRVALMFKNYGLTMFYMQMKLLKQLTLGSNDPDFTPEDRLVAFKQLAGMQLSSFALAGIAGVPLYGLVSAVADAFLGDYEEDADMLTRRYLGEGLYKGFLSDITGLDISSRIGLTGLLIRENRYNTNPSAEETLVANLGGPAWSSATQIGRGVSEFFAAMSGEQGDMVRGIENMVPASVRNFIKAGRYMYEGGDIQTRRKDVITGDLGASDLLGQALGFAPTKATLQQDLNQLKVRLSNAVSKRRSSLSTRYYIALREGDIEGAREVMEDIRAFNAEIRERFPEAVIDNEYLKNSLAGHKRTTKNMLKGVSVNSVVRDSLVDLESAFDAGPQLF